MTLGRFAIYTAVFGGYDYVPVPRGVAQGNPDLICFTDEPAKVPRGWRSVEITRPLPDAGMSNRHVKLFPNLYLESYDSSLYIDANVALRADPTPLVERYLASGPLAIPRHAYRDCVYDEAVACIAAHKAPAAAVNELMDKYRAAGMPRHAGLSENFLIARRHHDERVVTLAGLLWNALEAGPRRDQLHLPYLVWSTGAPLTVMTESEQELGSLLRRIPHQVRPGSVRDRYYRLLAREFPGPVGRLLEAALAGYARLKGGSLGLRG